MAKFPFLYDTVLPITGVIEIALDDVDAWLASAAARMEKVDRSKSAWECP